MKNVGIIGSAIAKPPSASPATLQQQSSVYLPGASGGDSYYTIPTGAGLIYPAGDWADIFCIKLNNTNASLTQHLYNNGGFGGGQLVSAYLVGGKLNARINDGSSQTISDPGTTFISSLGDDAGWYYLCVRRVSGNYELAVAPKSGAASTLISTAALNPGNTITPGSSTLNIGTRSDAGASTQMQKNQIAYYARVNGTFTNAQLTALAAGSDIITDLALSPLVYTQFNSSAATIADSSGNGKTATKVGNPALRGGPTFTGQHVTVDTSFANWWGKVFQRAPGSTSKTITATGTYRGSPTGIMVRVIDKTGAQVTTPKAATYPSAGVWSVSINVPQGAEYTLEAYHKDAPAKIARSQMMWGVGMVLLVTGESIADQQGVGSFTEAGLNPVFEQLSIFSQFDTWFPGSSYTAATSVVTDPSDGTVWRCAVNNTAAASGTFAAERAAHPTYWNQIPLYSCVTDFIAAPNGVVMHTIDKLRSALGIPVMACLGAKSGSQLVGGSPNNWGTYTDNVTHGKLKAAILNCGGDMEAMEWQQGANDANSASPPSASTYATAAQNVWTQIRTYLTLRIGTTLPIFSGIVGSNTAGGSPVDAGWRAVRTGTVSAINASTNVYEAGSLYDLAHADALHPATTTAGYYRLCKRVAQAVLNFLLPGTYTNSMKGAVFASASISGANTIDVVFTLNNGSTLQGLTGAAGLTGFVVTDAALANQTITATAIPSANTVRLTFIGVPVAGWTVDYVPTQNPTVTNPLYTNGSVVGDAAGIPVLPFTAAVVL